MTDEGSRVRHSEYLAFSHALEARDPLGAHALMGAFCLRATKMPDDGAPDAVTS